MKQLILISNPTPVPDEANLINELFNEGLQLFHLRKPDYPLDELKKITDRIKPEYYDRIVLPASLLKEANADLPPSKKVHFFEYLRMETKPEIFSELKEQGYTLSTSIHDSTAYHLLLSEFEYVFFGPVFDSISKQGYHAMNKEQLTVLQQKGKTKIIALGGINETNCSLALEYGFDGVAVLGAVWQSEHPLATFKKIRTCITSAR
jgi:thiamine-phosphate pyrophosphorylase